MRVGTNTLNITYTDDDMWCVVSPGGVRLSKWQSEREQANVLCCALCVKDDPDCVDRIEILAAEHMYRPWHVWLSFADGCYYAYHERYRVPQWYEIYIGTAKEIDTCLRQA